MLQVRPVTSIACPDCESPIGIGCITGRTCLGRAHKACGATLSAEIDLESGRMVLWSAKPVKRLPGQPRSPLNRAVQCSACKEYGHNSRNPDCKAKKPAP